MIEYHQITCRYFTWKKGLATFIGALWHQVANNLKHSGFVKKYNWLQSIIVVFGYKSNSLDIAPKFALKLSIFLLVTFWYKTFTWISEIYKVCSSYRPLAYFSDIFISFKNENIGKIHKRTITLRDFSFTLNFKVVYWSKIIFLIKLCYCKSWKRHLKK